VTRRIEERNKPGYREKEGTPIEIVKQEGSLQTGIISEQQNAGLFFAVAQNPMNIKGQMLLTNRSFFPSGSGP